MVSSFAFRVHARVRATTLETDMSSSPRITLLSAALLAAVSLHASAEDAPSWLDRVQVTGNRIEQPAERALQSVTVLTRADIEASRATDVSDLLAQQAGVDLVRTGGSGSQNSLFLRGGNANHTLVLVDGVRVNSASQGIFDLAHLPLAAIERMEIVRGPRAAVWGSDAIAGVIHIFTRAPDGVHGEIRAGSYGRAGFDAGFGTEGGGFGLSAGYDRLDGFSATNPGNVWSFDPDRDGYRNRHVALQGKSTLGAQTLSFSGIATRGAIEFDQGRTQADNHSWSAGLTGPLGGRWKHELRIGQAYEKLDTPAYSNVIGSRRESLDWAHTVRLGTEGAVAFGLNAAREQAYSLGWSGPDFRESRRNTGAFAVWNGQWQRQQLELATRWDDNSQFGMHHTASAGWAWQWDGARRLRASWGQGFRAPNFNELYYPGFFGLYAGNPDLQPERAQTAELGYESPLGGNSQLRLSAYRSRVSDLISFAGVNSQAINIAQARIKGAEAELAGAAGAWQWRAQGTWTQAVDGASGDPLLRRPKLKGLLAGGYRFDGGGDIGLELSGYGKRADIGTQLPGFARLDLTAAWPLSPAWRLEARLENLFDRDYELLDGYNTPGRSILLRLRHQGP